MAGIIVAFSKQEDAVNIKNILVRGGYEVSAVCVSMDRVLTAADDFADGVVVCGYRVGGAMYSQLRDSLPPTFDMLILASPAKLEDVEGEGILGLSMPLKTYDLINTMGMILTSLARKKKKRKSMPRERTPEEIKLISDAKKRLMERNSMTEEEAHKYMQKVSMDSGTNMVEAAHMIFDLF